MKPKSRTIKFRAWNYSSGTMVDLYKITPLALAMPDEGLYLPFHEDFLLMEYTGLNDRFGKEIYEWDIVDVIWDGKHTLAVVSFNHGHFIVRSKGRKVWRPLGKKVNQGISVRGNIFENPELLEEGEEDA